MMSEHGLPSTIRLGADVALANQRPLTLIAGINVLESLDLALRVAEHLRRATERHGMALVFKASFDKANRSSVRSFRGPGLERGLEWLARVKQTFGVPLVTDIHAAAQAAPAAEVVDLVQIPAFLVRQTDLIAAAAATGRPLHLKKMQMMAPEDMGPAVAKCAALGASAVAVCERGTLFGYGRLVVDMLGFEALKALDVPVTFDVTHSLQLPGALGHATGGRGASVESLAMAGVSQCIAALFLEVHPDPAAAKCDGPCALPLDRVDALLGRLAALDALVKSGPSQSESRER